MTMHTRFASRLVLAAALLTAALALAGCDNPFKPRIGYVPIAVEPPPRPNSPQNLMQLFRWCWVNQQISEYEDLFTDDFRFVFTDIEAVDNPAGTTPILRQEEIDIARRIFLDGSASEPRARRIEFTFVSVPIPIPDTRPNKPDPWHKLIQTRVTLRVELGDPTPITIDGDLNFFVVRGDSAALPADVIERLGEQEAHSTNRWYIERWEDKTAQPGPAGASAVHAAEMHEGVPIVEGRPRPPASRRATRSAASSAQSDTFWTWGDLMLLYGDTPP